MVIETDRPAAHSGARAAQQKWAATELRTRLRIVRKIRDEIACQSALLIEAFPVELRRNPAERFASELIPLAEAYRFLEEEAQPILAPRKLTRKRQPFWLRGVEVEERRDPVGVVLIVGPANYPLFLPGVQALQALVAGNAVLVKPGRGGGAVMRVFQRLAVSAGIPEDVLQILDEDIGAARNAIAEGVDKIVATGSVHTGRAIYRQAAERLTPVVLELSGCDPVFIRAGADLQRAADAIAFGMRWNNGETCIAPRRIFVAAEVAEPFEHLLGARHPETAALPSTRFESDEQALALAADSEYALGASVFGPIETARAFAARVPAGVVVVNDVIVPTADPRVPFGGRNHSGFGTTRGAEGLRQFTAVKAVVVQNRKRLWHLEPLPANAEELFGAYLAARNGWRMGERLRACRRLLRAVSRTRMRVE